MSAVRFCLWPPVNRIIKRLHISSKASKSLKNPVIFLSSQCRSAILCMFDIFTNSLIYNNKSPVMIKKILPTAMLAFLSLANAKEITTHTSVVNKSSCSQMAGTIEPFILVLDNGDNLLESITRCVKAAKLSGASISGLGQVHNPALAYFTSNPNDKPTVTNFSGYYELSSLNGNVSVNGNTYYTHAHAVLADKRFRGIAGHVDAATVGLTAEITIIPLSGSVQRTLDVKTGFGPLIHQ